MRIYTKNLYSANIQSRPASETPFEWRFTGGPTVARLYMLTEYISVNRVEHHLPIFMVTLKRKTNGDEYLGSRPVN